MLRVRAGDAVVEIDWAGIRGAIQRFEEEYDDVYLVFRPSAPYPATVDVACFAAVGSAAVQAAQHSAARAAAQGPDFSPYGPVLWLDYPGTNDQTCSFLLHLAEQVAEAGWSGTLGPFTELDLPDPMYDRMSPSKPTVFGSFSMRSAPDVTARSVAWCLARPHDVIRLDVGVNSIALPTLDPAGCLSLMLEVGAKGGITAWRDGEEPARRVLLEPGRDGSPGVASWQAHGAAADWRSQLDDLVSEMCAQAACFELLVVRREPRWTQVGWSSYDFTEPHPPFLDSGDLLRHPHLLDRFVPDAHGVQVLSDLHLERAGSLADWRVEKVCPGRYLVTARDLEPWFAGAQPDPAVLSAAREAFGPLILTPADLTP